MTISISRMKNILESKKVEDEELEGNPCQTQSEFINVLANDLTNYFCK